MEITVLRSDEIYNKMVKVTSEEREEIFRYELMKPFEFKWKCIGVPLKSPQNGGYDVVTASTMMGGYHPAQITEKLTEEIRRISADPFWSACENSILNTLESFENNGIKLPIQKYIFTVLLSDPQNHMSAMIGDRNNFV